MKRKKKIFWKVYWIIFAMLLAAVITVLYFLYQFLIVYENSQPQYFMNDVMKLFEENRIEEILSYDKDGYDKEYEKDICAGYLERIEGKEFSYDVKYGEYTDAAPVYAIYTGKDEVARVYLKADEKSGKFNSKNWKLDKIAGVVEKRDDITIAAPSSYIVTVNGRPVTSDMSDSKTEIEAADHYLDYVKDLPTMNSYTVSNIYCTPEVECKTPDGQVVAKLDSNRYDFEFDLKNSDVSEELKTEIDSFVHHYVRFCMNEEDLSQVIGMFIDGTSSYHKIRTMAQVTMYSGRHDKLEISPIEVEEYTIYNENAYRVKLKFDYTVFSNDLSRVNPTILVLYYAKVDGQWKIVEFSTNSK